MNEDSLENKAVLLVGNPSQGWTVVGPFDTWDDAAEASYHYHQTTWVMELSAHKNKGVNQ